MALDRSDDEIEEQISRASDSVARGSTRWPGMTYEQGVDAALRWVLGENDEAPMED